MSNTINFDQIAEDNKNNAPQQYVRKTADPGVDIFTTEEAEVKQNVNGKEFIGIKFVNGAGKYFKEQFYTNGNGGKRVAELAINSGLSLKGEVTTADIAPQLIGTSVGLIVGGEKELAVIDGKEVIVTRAKIKKAYNFSFKPADLEKFKDSKIEIEDKTASAVETMGVPASDSSDLPF